MENVPEEIVMAVAKWGAIHQQHGKTPSALTAIALLQLQYQTKTGRRGEKFILAQGSVHPSGKGMAVRAHGGRGRILMVDQESENKINTKVYAIASK